MADIRKEPCETDLAFARRNASDVISALTEVLYVLESGRQHIDGRGWAEHAKQAQLIVCDYLANLEITPEQKAELEKLKRENESLKSLLYGMARNIDGLLKMYGD